MRLLVCMGTRPERLKLLPVISALTARGVRVDAWHSGQSPDLTLDAPPERAEWWREKGLHGGIAAIVEDFWRFQRRRGRYDAVIVQGDTATAFGAAVGAFLAGIPVAHVEAGLRTYASEPWPEEAFRRAIAAFSRWHFAPDEDAQMNLIRETRRAYPLSEALERQAEILKKAREPASIFVVGNPIIDTLPREPFKVLVTLHRRENWGRRIESALLELDRFASEDADGVAVECVVHPNWKVAVQLDPERDFSALKFVEPMAHEALIERIRAADVVVTDSGGLQEEAAHYGIPCIVVRSATERVALVKAGAVTLCDPDDPSKLSSLLCGLLGKRRAYGCGDAGERIAEILVQQLAPAEAAESGVETCEDLSEPEEAEVQGD